MNVLMTSFRRSHGVPAPTYSVAMYQPKGFEYPRVDWALIGNPNGTDWIRPRNYQHSDDPLREYKAALMHQYLHRIEDAQEWFKAQQLYAAICFCCWCPHDRAAHRQLAEFETYVCHHDVLGEFLETYLGVRVWYDHDRRLMKAIRP